MNRTEGVVMVVGFRTAPVLAEQRAVLARLVRVGDERVTGSVGLVHYAIVYGTPVETAGRHAYASSFTRRFSALYAYVTREPAGSW